MVIAFPEKYKELLTCVYSGKHAARKDAFKKGPLTLEQYKAKLRQIEGVYLLGMDQLTDPFGWRINQLLLRQHSYVACARYSMTKYRLLGLVRQFMGSVYLGSLWSRSQQAARVKGDELGITGKTLDNLSIKYLMEK